MPTRALITSLLAACALALAPGAALAADTYVNGDDAAADDSGACTTPTVPCETIGAALGKAGDGDTVHVDDFDNSNQGYVESLEVTDSKSIIAEDLDGSHTGQFTITGTSSFTIKVSFGNTGGTISGFTLAPAIGSGNETVFLEGPATFRDNQINNPNAGAAALDISTPAGGDGTVIDHNTFNGPGSGTANTGIAVSEGNPQITTNNISTPANGFKNGVLVSNGSDPTISGNTFQALFASSGSGIAVYIQNAHATITGNLMNEAGSGQVHGIVAEQL